VINRRRAVAATLAAGSLPAWLAGCERPGAANATVPWQGGWVDTDAVHGHQLRDAAAQPSPAEPTSSTRVAVVIVGAGVAGLAAARALQLAGVDDFVLLELAAQGGGNARAHRMDGVRCPLGAHYLPVPGDTMPELQTWLQTLGLMTHTQGRWRANEAHLCHAPQERVWFEGQWVEGLLPPAEPRSVRAQQYQRFADAVAQAARTLRFVMPAWRGPWTAGHQALDAVTFKAWLTEQGLNDDALLGYLDYACRDDYGAGIATVSAWAGLHYFASRHGFHGPESSLDTIEPADDAGVFTWPEGNGWLTQQLSALAGDRLRAQQWVTRVESRRDGVAVDATSVNGAGRHRWLAQRVVLATPLHVTSRLVPFTAITAQSAAAVALARVGHAPWLVANLQLNAALDDRQGAAPAWDNVMFQPAGTSDALGYVDANHQSLSPVRGATVLTAYWALGRDGADDMRQQRRALLDEPWQRWSQRVVADLAHAHPDLPARITRTDLMRYGHAMVIPSPGTQTLLRSLREPLQQRVDRLHFAHSDWSGYSVFEEAFAMGHAVGGDVAEALGRRRQPG
jgi:predicted NAD/FAD-dependent oxidoreductase